MTAPGRIVDAAGLRLHLLDEGTGEPAIVIVPGAGNLSLDWTRVSGELASLTRVLTLDRPGYAFGDQPPAGPRTLATVAAEMAGALDAAGVRAPYVLAGHSLGGLYIKRFAQLYPHRVAGLVFLDSSDERQARLFAETGIKPILDKLRRRSELAMKLGPVVRLLLRRQFKQLRPDLDAAQRRRLVSLHGSAAKMAAVNREVAWLEDGAEAEVAAGPSLPVVPARVLMRGKADPLPGGSAELQAKIDEVWNRCQGDLAAAFPGCVPEPVVDSGHMLMYDRPDAVVAAIREVWAAARAGVPATA
jgi:pimeloyl-ACP methyl ester carboxylesterase